VTMTTVNDLYQETILDHHRRPHNFQKMDDATSSAEGYNPLCGDRVRIYVRLEDGKLGAISFQGNGCAISRASASIMTDAVRHKSEKEIRELANVFRDLVTGKSAEHNGLGKLAVFSGVSEFPARVKCATLAWHTLEAALDRTPEVVTTEQGGAPI